MLRPGATDRYISLPEAQLSGGAGGKKKTEASNAAEKDDMDPLFKCVVRGDSDNIQKETRIKLDEGKTPKTILDEYLIPGINEVGRLYDEKIYFLPQLIAGAGAMEAAVSVLEPLMEESGSDKKETVVIATVEGDIHDIGKNLVALMLKNYGYKVIDLGKDVAADVIVDTAIKEGASVIGLSALMTTTMVHMKTVVELAKEKGCTAKIVIGGACITDDYAKEIGADGYSEDASECVKLVQKLLNIQ
jgi:5-methyltetrahydrofolate--homocysteine methyltransferase